LLIFQTPSSLSSYSCHSQD